MTSPSSSSKSAPSGASGKNSAVALTAGGNNIELGKYRITRLLGQGGFGITYLAQHMETGQEVVVKENLPTDFMFRDPRNLQVMPMSDELEADCRWAMESFLQEAKLLMQLNHPNIVKVQDTFSALGTAYYVMPWVGGNELGQAAPPPDKITENWLSPILRQLLEALQYLHGQNILHRDIKPSNILMSEGGEPVLIDFGAARAIISEKSATKVGSPGYTPIEQVQSKGKRGPWTDLYALGATCYRLITGHRPPQCEDRIDEEDDEYHPLAPQAKLYSRFSRDFLAAIDKALAVRGKNRWQKAEEWLATLPAFASVPGVIATAITPAPAPKTARIPLYFKLLFFGQLLILLGGGWYGYRTITGMKAQNIARATADAQAIAQAQAAEKEALHLRGVAENAHETAQAEISRLRIEAESARKAAQETTRLRAEAETAHEAAQEEITRLRAEAETARKEADEAERKAADEAERKAAEKEAEAARKADKEKATRKTAKIKTERAKSKSAYTRQQAIRTLEEKDIYPDDYGQMLIQATEEQDISMIQILLTAGANVNEKNLVGRTILSMATCSGMTEIIKLLLQTPGININKEDNLKKTPLYHAAHYGRTEIARLLIKARADVNKADDSKQTPLYIAAKNGHTEIVKLLIDAGADVNRADNLNRTPLNVAKTGKIKQMLRTAGGILGKEPSYW